MKKLNLSKRTYLIAFTFVMLLNSLLAVFLFRTVLAQNSGSNLRNQPPVIAEVVRQTDNPLLITVMNVDNSNPNYQLVNYTVQNMSNKPVKGFVIWGDGKNTGQISTNFFPTKFFQIGASYTEELYIDRENIKRQKNFPFLINLSVDYVEFDDGSFWGKDTQGQSEHIAGAFTGAEIATEQLKGLIANQERAVLATILEKQLVDVEVPLPDAFKDRSEKWQKGFRNGYKSIVSFLKSQKNVNNEEFLKKLD
jgi:hypothetical protein